MANNLIPEELNALIQQYLTVPSAYQLIEQYGDFCYKTYLSFQNK